MNKYNARLVARGFTQTYRVDNLETFSPSTHLNFIGVLFSMDANQQWLIFQLNVKNASCMMTSMMRSIWSNHHLCIAQGKTMVCKLKKTTYGLKWSPQAWFEKFSRVVSAGGFQQSDFNHSVFIHQSSTRSIVLAFYVDDILLTGSVQLALRRPRNFLMHIL